MRVLIQINMEVETSAELNELRSIIEHDMIGEFVSCDQVEKIYLVRSEAMDCSLGDLDDNVVP